MKNSKERIQAALRRCEQFTKDVLGIKVNLADTFEIPKKFPWHNVLFVFDPRFDNREALTRALISQRVAIKEEPIGEGVAAYSGSEPSPEPKLYAIQSAVAPNVSMRDHHNGYTCLTLRGYLLATGQYLYFHKQCLDMATWTWFPDNRIEADVYARACFQTNGNCIWIMGSPTNVCPPHEIRLAVEIPRRAKACT